jgi:hypothetical protein
VNHTPPLVDQDQEHEQHAEGCCRQGEEVDRGQRAEVVVEEGAPLGRIAS